MKHSPEPWKAKQIGTCMYLLDKNGDYIAQLPCTMDGFNPNVQRILNCVNGAKGIPDPVAILNTLTDDGK